MTNTPTNEALEILGLLGKAREIVDIDLPRSINEKVEKCLDDAVALIWNEYDTGPVNEREEVTGLSTNGTNKNLGNSGFSGGSMRGGVPLRNQ